MLKKDITYKDLDGNDVTDTFYFNMTRGELVEKELSFPGGLINTLEGIVKSGEPGMIIRAFKDILMESVGRRSADGKRFIKDQEARDAFMQSDAFSVVFTELVTEADKAAEFMSAIIPQDLAEAVKAKQMENIKVVDMVLDPASQAGNVERVNKHYDEYTDEELVSMPHLEWVKLVGRNPQRMTREQLVMSMRRRGTNTE